MYTNYQRPIWEYAVNKALANMNCVLGSIGIQPDGVSTSGSDGIKVFVEDSITITPGDGYLDTDFTYELNADFTALTITFQTSNTRRLESIHYEVGTNTKKILNSDDPEDLWGTVEFDINEVFNADDDVVVSEGTGGVSSGSTVKFSNAEFISGYPVTLDIINDTTLRVNLDINRKDISVYAIKSTSRTPIFLGIQNSSDGTLTDLEKVQLIYKNIFNSDVGSNDAGMLEWYERRPPLLYTTWDGFVNGDGINGGIVESGETWISQNPENIIAIKGRIAIDNWIAGGKSLAFLDASVPVEHIQFTTNDLGNEIGDWKVKLIDNLSGTESLSSFSTIPN